MGNSLSRDTSEQPVFNQCKKSKCNIRKCQQREGENKRSTYIFAQGTSTALSQGLSPPGKVGRGTICGCWTCAATEEICYLAKQGCEGIYKCFKAVNILSGLELRKLTEVDTQISYLLLAEGLQLHCKGLFTQGFRSGRVVLIILNRTCTV